VHVATPGLPGVTVVRPQPVFALHVTVPLTSCRFLPFDFTNPYSPPIVAVNVTDCAYTDGFTLEPTVIVTLA
jgi:hypothetical protein